MQPLVAALACALLALTAAACASASGGRSAQGCVLAAADSAYLAAGPLYRDCAVDQPARALQTRTDFAPPPSRQPGVTCYSADVQFVVDANGRPEPGTIRLVRGSGGAFPEAVLASVAGWVYAPALLNGVPVRQLVRERRTAASVVTVTMSQGGSPPRPPRPPDCR
jgi:hypothetical protein